MKDELPLRWLLARLQQATIDSLAMGYVTAPLAAYLDELKGHSEFMSIKPVFEPSNPQPAQEQK